MRRLLYILALVGALLPLPAVPQEAAIPGFWDLRERLVLPDISKLPRIRFLTTVDFPPFNFIDGNGLLTGFHVDLARAICRELSALDRCEIQAMPWDELQPALEAGQGEAIVAGLAVTEDARERFAFSRAYMRFPARFVAARNSALNEPMWRSISGKRVGVISSSAHELMLRDHFPEARAVTFDRRDWMLAALARGELDAVFDDGMRLGFWLAGEDARDCCAFVGGPYLAPEYFGAGLSIAVKADNAALAEAFDYALREINAKGIFDELYLRYFPVSFF